ncbi:hypothetical protein ACFWWM_42055, partial [Streptomyces sp. NPDC058682]|uniref:hypothetical protein n=1 Tax=Streptomyces sp. NPDC058682 TaxID=3346596 RepID=UPI003666D1EF
MTNWDQMWTDYLAGLDDDRRLAALALQERFAELGADEPQGWALLEGGSWVFGWFWHRLMVWVRAESAGSRSLS